MNYLEIPRVDDWLSQFGFPDRYLAEHIVRKMRYVGFEEVEEWLQQELLKLLSDINSNGKREAIAIFPVAKPFIHDSIKIKRLNSQMIAPVGLHTQSRI